LVELLVAMAVGALVIVMLLSVLSGTMSLSRKTNETLLGANAAAAALDLIGSDLESLAVTGKTNFEYLRLINEEVTNDAGHTISAAKVILLTISANDVGSSASEAGQVRAVVYRLGYQDVVNPSGTNKIYGLYRSLETNAATNFADYIGQSDLSGTALFTDAPLLDDFLAGNIVDLRVRFYPAGASIPLNTNAVIRIGGGAVTVGGTVTNAATAEVSLTYLEEAGAQLLKNGTRNLDEVKKSHGYTLSRKVPIRTPVVTP
jgi:type II secretory pathway pseudopilin PulG